MPDRDNWTAAMVVKWLLTRDKVAVVAMADTYGAVAVFEDGTVSRLVPEDIDAVTRAYCIDESVPPGEERTAAAVVRGGRVIAAKDEVYCALRHGKLEARARRNGTGDTVRIEPHEWPTLRFESSGGRDIARPVTVVGDPLPLPRELEDYFSGGVPVNAMPAAWPDPLFMAQQVLDLWPPKKLNQESVGTGGQSKAAKNKDETIADRNRRWYDDFEVRRRAGSYRNYELIFKAMSIEEFKHCGVAATIKKAVNAIRSEKGETGQRKIARRRV
jgi:hypothetical protein